MNLLQNVINVFHLYLNNVSTITCETWNAHCARATIELLQKETPEFIPPQLWPPNLPIFNDKLIIAWLCANKCCFVNDRLIDWLIGQVREWLRTAYIQVLWTLKRCKTPRTCASSNWSSVTGSAVAAVSCHLKMARARLFTAAWNHP